MTEQLMDHMENKCPKIDFEDLKPSIVILGPVEKNHGWGIGEYEYAVEPKSVEGFSQNWSGYLCNYRLTDKGRLVLVSYVYTIADIELTTVNETLEGDFYLVMKPDFHGIRTYVPFVNGLIVEDKSKWLHEESIEIEIPPEKDLYKTYRLDKIELISDKIDQAIELGSYISTRRSSFRSEKAIDLLGNILNNEPVSWMKALSLSKSIRKWPIRYQGKGEKFLKVLANQLLDQSKDPKYKWTRNKILQTISEYFHDTDAFVEASNLLKK